MKNLLFLVMILFLGAGFSYSSLAQEESKDEKKETTTVEQNSDNKAAIDSLKAFNTICPVSTEDVDPEITYTYKGKTYALCCNNCLKKFKKDPEKYISKLSDDGKSIKKKSE